jgi:hypothetical protein
VKIASGNVDTREQALQKRDIVAVVVVVVRCFSPKSVESAIPSYRGPTNEAMV